MRCANWRQFIKESTSVSDNPHEKSLWRLLQWSKLCADKSQVSPHISSLCRSEQDNNCDDNSFNTQILTEKFFSKSEQADLSNINRKVSADSMLDIFSAVTAEQVEQTINRLSNEKALKSNNISKEALKIMTPFIKKNLMQTISRCFDSESTSESFWEFTTVVLQKKRKKDYSLSSSYCFIALKNTIIKLIKKLIAEWIACAAEMHSLLSWNQMRVRKQQFTLSALKLLTSCVNTVWKTQSECIVFMLSLNLEKTFDNVSHERLLHIMHSAGFSS